MLGDDSKIQAQGIESVSMELKDGKKKTPVTFIEVLYVSELGSNLVSCGELERVVIRSIFYGCECILENRRASFNVIGRAPRAEEVLYVLNCNVKARKAQRKMVASDARACRRIPVHTSENSDIVSSYISARRPSTMQ